MIRFFQHMPQQGNHPAAAVIDVSPACDLVGAEGQIGKMKDMHQL
ncbi:hypothetical protein [Desulfatiferula olefinivorans]